MKEMRSILSADFITEQEAMRFMMLLEDEMQRILKEADDGKSIVNVTIVYPDSLKRTL